jgi:hypothetical protein
LGYAVAVHGYPRATGDMDIWITISGDNAHKTVEALIEFGFNTPNLTDELFLTEGKNIRMGNSPLRIEILTSIDGVEFSECYSNRRIVAADDVEASVISLDDLKKNKKASGRHQDLADLEHLER